MSVYCRRRKIRCLPPIGEGDRCQNCARQQRDCVVQPIAGSTRKGGRNQGNALSTDPMPYSEALSLTRSANNPSLAHRRAQKGSIERYHEHGYYPSSISIPSYGYAGTQTMSIPFSAPAHFSSPPMLPSQHTSDSGYITDGARRPPFKHMSTAPGGMYTLHGGDPGSWQQTSHYTGISPQDSFHPSSQEVSSDPNPFWRLSASLTSPQTNDVSLPPPRPGQWPPNSANNYTHERVNGSLPTPHHSALDAPTFQNTAQQFYANGMNAPVNHTFQSPASHAPAGSHDEHCGDAWPRTVTGYRNGTSV